MVTRPKAQLISYHHFVEKKIFHCSLLPTELSMIPLHSVQSSWPLSKPHVYCDLSMAPKAIQEEKDKISLQNSFSSAFGILSLPPAIISAQPKQPSSPLPILNLKLPVSCFYCNQPGPSCSLVQSRWHLQEPLNGLSTSTPDPSGLFLTQHSEWSFKNKYRISSLSSKLFWDFPGP